MTEILQDRLSEVMGIELLSGGHSQNDKHRMCVMEAVAYIAGEPWTDAPACACPVICAFMQAWNDSLPDAERTALLRPLIPRLVGTRSTKEIEVRRSFMAADWLVRTHTSAWLRLAGLATQADMLATLPEITGMAQVPSIRGPLEAARSYVAAARDAAWIAAEAAAVDAAWAAAVDAVGEKLRPVKEQLQASALALVERMIAANKDKQCE